MGMYTGLRCKVIIKKEYRHDIDLVVNHDIVDYNFRKKIWSPLLKNFYFNISRATSIPHGNVEIYKDTWADENKYGFELFFDINTGLLKFECSLKNYEDTIEYFIENILPKICDKSFHIETIYSECDSSLLYEIKDGKLEELETKIFYGCGYDMIPNKCISCNEYDFSYNNLV